MSRYRSVALLLAAAPGIAQAHAFGMLYTLPLPFWMYTYGAAAALLLSFVVAAYFLQAPHPLPQAASGTGLQCRPALFAALRALSVGGLWLTILTGLGGSRDPAANFSMTFFWIVFALGFFYLGALVGDLYAWINPWKTMIAWLDRRCGGCFRGRLEYPTRWGYAPALLLYFVFLWIELFGHTGPRSLSLVLLGYSLLNLVGAWLIGPHAWFRYCEFFAVLFRLAGQLAPLEYLPGATPAAPRIRRRAFLSGLRQTPAEHGSLLLFVLLMLAATAFDGLRETRFFGQLFRALAQGPLAAADPALVANYAALRRLFTLYSHLALLLVPLSYLALYLASLLLARQLSGRRLPLRKLALAFAWPLIPIAFVYHLSHYYTLLLTQGLKIGWLTAELLDLGWDEFAFARWAAGSVLMDAAVIWHTQLALILAGHIASVILAHQVALQLFADRRAALLSQLPLLLLMLAYTVIGLWLLSLPFAPPQ